MSEMQQIISKLDNINTKVDQLLLWKAALNERCDSHLKNTNEMHKTLYDNPGIVSKVQRLENCKKFLASNQSRWADFWMYLLKALVVISVVSFVSLMVKVLGLIAIFNGAR